MDSATLKMQEQALEWLLRLEEDRSQECRKAFLDWCEQSRDRVQAFLEVTVLDRELNHLDPDGNVDIHALIQECRQSPAGTAAATILPIREPVRVTPTAGLRRRRVAWATAAMVAAGLLGFAGFTLRASDPVYLTQTGEQRSVKLADGSVIYLNTRSKIQVRYSDKARQVDLLEGEAFFAVGRDPARPFKVVAGDATVQALGTEFNVYRENARTTVSVTEGKVQVTTNAQPVSLDKGETAQVLKNLRVVKKTAVEIAHAIAWRQRQLDFRRATLFEVATEFNRYNTLKIEIADPRIGERQLNGVFDADMPEQLLKFLEQRQDLRFERTPGTVVIHAREE